MKNKMMLIAAAMLSGIAAFGQITFVSTGGLNYGTGTTNYAIIGQPPVIQGQTPGLFPGGQLRPVLTFLSATSDALASTTTGAGNLQFFYATNEVVLQAASTGLTNVVQYNGGTGFGSSNGLGANTEIVIQHIKPQPDQYELAYVSALSAPITGGTNLFTNYSGTITTNLLSTLTLAVVTTNAMVAGDIVWMMSSNGVPKIPVGVATLNIGPGTGIVAGLANSPLLGIIRGGTNCSINTLSATYTP